MGLNETPRGERIHIAIYGRRNSGKSSLINALTGQNIALVSDVAGTTADPVYKPMEVRGLGACAFIDTAGFDDEGALGALRVEKTRETLSRADLALLVISGESARPGAGENTAPAAPSHAADGHRTPPCAESALQNPLGVYTTGAFRRERSYPGAEEEGRARKKGEDCIIEQLHPGAGEEHPQDARICGAHAANSPRWELSLEREWWEELSARHIPTLVLISKTDLVNAEALGAQVQRELDLASPPLAVSAATGEGIDALLAALVRLLPEGLTPESITGALVRPGDVVLLVMPQDAEAPKGRLILPQVQTIRDLIDNRCTPVCTTPEEMPRALAALCAPPALVITDSQAFAHVRELCPAESRLTSFSILFAAFKGDLDAFVEGARAADRLTPHSRVLIAEACTHAPLTEDIGRVKIPALLRKRYGATLQVDVVSGADFPADLSPYDLVVHCGGCMFNRKYILSRVAQAESCGVPITNYGVLLAKLNGILDKVTLPPSERTKMPQREVSIR